MAVPRCLHHYYQLATYYLRGGMMVAVAEAHNKKHGRVLCEHLLQSGHVKVFYIEYYNKKVSGYLLMGVEHRMGESVEEIRDAYGNYFERLNKYHAKPSLEDLSVLAVSRSIEVVPADPEIDIQYKGHGSLVPRDNAAAKYIANDSRNKLSIGQGALILWGEDHFVRHPSHVAYDEQGLHKLIRKHLPGTPVMLVNVANLTDPV